MGIDITTLKSVRDELDRFVDGFGDCIKTRPSRKHFRTWINGQLSSLERKTAEPIALASGTPPRTLQEFLSLHRWDEEKVRARLQRRATEHVGDAPTIGVIDETGFPKKGDKTPGVQRQYCGQTGKTDNCVVAVHLALATTDFHTLVDAEPFLPEHSWSNDRERCRAAGIPDDVVHRPKWRIGLELFDRAKANGMRFNWIVADEAYGAVPAFRDELDQRGQKWIVEVPRSLMGWTRAPKLVVPEKTMRTGRPRTRAKLAPGQPASRRIESLWKRGGPSWQSFRVKPTQKGDQVWNARVIRFVPQVATDTPGKPRWLIVAVHALNEQHKYFLSNAPEDTAPAELLEVAFGRWHIEKCFQEAKQEVGLGHFEVRTWIGLRRHLVLSMVSLLFLSQQTQRLRGEKGRPTVESLTGAGGS